MSLSGTFPPRAPLARLPRAWSRAALCVALLLATVLILALSSRFKTPDARSEALAPGATGAAGTPGASEPAPAPVPLVLLEMTRDQARAFNATVPLSTAPNPPLAPFVHRGSAADRERARICLAQAAWYEAGDDRVGQQAVVQVVLNRVRHPTYPKSVCGVVFQGSERASGCQFTFTCDGSLRRIPAPDAWQRAIAVADAALSGTVFAAVGTATHYHTNWVVPYWSASLDKITEIHTHLFFRWRGRWGLPSAFTGRYKGEDPAGAISVAGGTPRIDLTHQDLASLLKEEAVPGARPATVVAAAAAPLSAGGADLRGSVLRLSDDGTGDYVLALDPRAQPGEYAVAALSVCEGKPVCTVIGWLDADEMPAKLPVAAAAQQTASFLYRRRDDPGIEETFWDCRERPRKNRLQCLPGTWTGATAEAS